MNLQTVAPLLDEKRRTTLLSVAPELPVAHAVRAMSKANVGAAVVLDRHELVGILTERDVMVRVVALGLDPADTQVNAVMTSAVATVTPSTRLLDAMKLMAERSFRHLPVVDRGQLCGLISMRDLTEAVIRAQTEELTSAIRAVKTLAFGNRRG